MSGYVAQFDASPWGAGAVLLLKGKVMRYWHYSWQQGDASHLGVLPGHSRHQTFWELAALLICLVTWGDEFREECLAVVGDNVASLQCVLALKGRGPLLAISREIAWRQAAFAWKFEVGHIPTEANKLADTLSRLTAPSPAPFPLAALRDALPSGVPFFERALEGISLSMKIGHHEGQRACVMPVRCSC